jgi:hypothetical protein
LHKALLTGIQRVAKEGIFSGLNNLKVYTVLENRYSDYFGFTAEETEALLKDFIEFGDKVTLITRARRFGKTLNMTMLREFFDITKDSKEIFNGLAIMETEYANQINSRPVIYFSFKDCKATTLNSLFAEIKNILWQEYMRYYEILKGNVDESHLVYRRFFIILERFINDTYKSDDLKNAIVLLEQVTALFYGKTPIVLIDEYDQPIIAGYEYEYHTELKAFFAVLYGSALKGQEYLHKALLTGIQRVAKEGIFSGLNNLKVYTVLENRYSDYFGFTAEETEALLKDFGKELEESVKQKYDGYIIGKTEIYNPWSILYYTEDGRLKNYWINTSDNYLIKQSLKNADNSFKLDLDKMRTENGVEVYVKLDSSIIELNRNDALWGLFINAGYATVIEQISENLMKVRIPNEEVKTELEKFIVEIASIKENRLYEMFQRLMAKDIEKFKEIYQNLVLDYTSYNDSRENAYHMLLLGMTFSIEHLYRISSNIEAGHGRPDIRMESKIRDNPHIIVELKKCKDGENIETLKDEALQQIIDNQYHRGLTGEILCLGIAHDVKRCAIAYNVIESNS